MEEISVSRVMENMIAYSNGNMHDISHFLKVYAYARTIGIIEGLPQRQQMILETAAIVHDIACPLCRAKYGNADGKHQEEEGGALTRELLGGLALPEDVISRVVYLVEHHHTYTNVDGMDYQILLEADFLVNADEGKMDRKAIETTLEKVFRTATGSSLLSSMYLKVCAE